MSQHASAVHPGPYIRQTVIPQGMAVTEVARLVGIGRPAVSNFLNGNAALSPDMAARIARAFGADANALLAMQAAYDAALATERGAAAVVRSYVPPFLRFTAIDLEKWADTIRSRSRLAVLLRVLVHSTSAGVSRVDFPGNDESERAGWDGFAVAPAASPWVPAGESGWEFGVNKDARSKADDDYKMRTGGLPASERAEITFVFVTPRRWKGKTAWEHARRAEKNWRDVRAFDASDLEQWLEQSIPAQVWLADELGRPTDGVASLDGCWMSWIADCAPHLSEALFDSAVSTSRELLKSKLGKSESIIVAADSCEEALAFLHCALDPSLSDLAPLRDRVVVFSRPGSLARLTSGTPNLIAIVTSREVEKELAPIAAKIQSIVVSPRNSAVNELDIALEPLGYSDFEKALQQTGLDRDAIDRLSRESGRSLTVLRRRLSRSNAIRTPEWASTPKLASGLVPFVFAGQWKSDHPADRAVLELLGDQPVEELDKRFNELNQIEDSPIWAIGVRRGVVSKIDALFGVRRAVTPSDLDRFFQAAGLVLSEDDPALDLAEDKRWAAPLYGKVRDTSAELREGLSETLVLLSVHGPELFKEQLGVDTRIHAGRLVRELLEPLTARKLEANARDLPLYAEAAPEIFLEVLEADLGRAEPESLKMMTAAKAGVFGGSRRTGLLWALEGLAWNPGFLPRVVEILARLAAIEIDDNLANKPSASLSTILKCWIPQTAAPLQERIAALDCLASRHPRVAWPICVEQFKVGSSSSLGSHKPRWRTDARGFGERVSPAERRAFALHALDLALGWRGHDKETLGDLVSNAQNLPDEQQQRVWDLVDSWAKDALDEDRADLREIVRRRALMRRNRRNAEVRPRWIARARTAYERLMPSDVVLEHEWLFRTQWVEESADDFGDESADYKQREEKIATKRLDALRCVVRERGTVGAIALAERGEAAWVVGWLMTKILLTNEERTSFVDSTSIGDGSTAPLRSLVSGFLAGLSDADREAVICSLVTGKSDDYTALVLTLAPCRAATWKIARRFGPSVDHGYWRAVSPGWRAGNADELRMGVDSLVANERPRAAFRFAHLDLEDLPPRKLFELMRAMATSASEEPGTYLLNPHEINEAFKLLNASRDITTEEMAGLEFAYLEALEDRDVGIPSLEQQVNDRPELFCELVAYAFKRSDSADDPENICESDAALLGRRAERAYRLLKALSKVPGRDQAGEVETTRLVEWISRVRQRCIELARADVCESVLGEILSNAPVGEDGIWPCESVRSALEKVATPGLARGLQIGVYNARGAHWRGEGGQQERDLAAKHFQWARSLRATHPRVATMLQNIAEGYEHDAEREDLEAKARRRII